MIATVTFNPSLDYIVQLSDFHPGRVNRTAAEAIYPGGKGINVSIVLQNLGFSSKVLGFCAGFTGEEIDRMLKAHGCDCDLIRVENGLSRINVKLKADAETEVNGQGPVILTHQLEELFGRLGTLESDDILVLAGSVPSSLPDDIYEQILKRLAEKNVRFVVDASGALLKRVLPYRPFLIKPNHHELGELFGTELSTRQSVIPYAKKLQELGARNVLVSMAGEGAVLLDETGRVYESAPPDGVVVNSVGAGDSMVAGFLAGWLSSGSYEQAFRMGIAAGSASAFTDWLASKEQIEALL